MDKRVHKVPALRAVRWSDIRNPPLLEIKWLFLTDESITHKLQ